MEKRIEEGPPIYIESLMTTEEIKVRCRTYPTSHLTTLRNLSVFAPGLMKWRYRMGLSLLPDEAATFNKEIGRLKAKYYEQTTDIAGA